MKYLLKILDISGADIAEYAGVTRQAVHNGSRGLRESAEVLITAAKFDPEKMEAARQAQQELKEFLKN